ncbi:MAG: CPBP family glutamic-type intramembrane protease [Vulcanibacillus sp.]
MNLIALILLSFVPYITTYFGLYVLSNAWIALLSYHLVIVIVLIKRNKELKKIRYLITNKKIFLSSIILTLFTLPLLILLWDFIKLPNLDLSNMLKKFNLDGISFVLFIIYIATIHPVLEELYWRLIITYEKSNKLDFLFDIIFAGYHILVLTLFVKIPFVIISVIVLAISGMFWRYIIKRYQDYLSVFAMHSIADLLIMIAIFTLTNNS